MIAVDGVLGATTILLLVACVGGVGFGQAAPVSVAATAKAGHHPSTTVTNPTPTTATTQVPTTRTFVTVPPVQRTTVPVPPPTQARAPTYSIPTYSYPTYTPPTYTSPLYSPPTRLLPTTLPTTTTIAPLGGHLPVPPSTLPLLTKGDSSHVSPVYAALSGAGFFVALCIMAGRWILTRPRRLGR